MAKVYVTQESNHDFTPAEQWGDVEFLTKEEISPIKQSLRNEALLEDLEHKLKKYDPDEDFIVVAGSPYVAALVFYLLGRRGVPQIRMLRWSNRDRLYGPLIVSTRGESDGK